MCIRDSQKKAKGLVVKHVSIKPENAFPEFKPLDLSPADKGRGGSGREENADSLSSEEEDAQPNTTAAASKEDAAAAAVPDAALSEPDEPSWMHNLTFSDVEVCFLPPVPHEHRVLLLQTPPPPPRARLADLAQSRIHSTARSNIAPADASSALHIASRARDNTPVP
eukprot:3617028-Rhodomonas_salina.2